MVIIITGATHTGKTKLAQRILEMKNYPYLSIDHLKMGLIRSGNTNLTVEDDGELTKYLWPIVSEMIKTSIENKQNLIVEGCYVPFDWKKDFSYSYISNIKYICLAFSKEYIENNMNSIIEHENDIEDRIYELNNNHLIEDNEYYINGCKENNLPCKLVTKDYNLVIDGILNELKYYNKKSKNLSGEDMDILNDRKFKRKNDENVCDRHWDGA